MEYYFLIPLLAGFALDLLLGDPLWLPHPIRLYGNVIAALEKRFNRGLHKRTKGAILAFGLIVVSFLVFFFLLKFVEQWSPVFLALASIGVFFGLANHNLITESLKVIRVLRNEGLEAGRKQLSFIVGRDTSELNEQQIRTAVLETLAENLSDGVIAPLFFYALGGVPSMLAYKMVNTLDSMWGYKSERYLEFGWFAARFDDLMNYIPARITALLMVLVTFSWRGLVFIFRYGKKHSSPNSGYPEAALAGILNCRFGGPNNYHGKLMQKPYIGKQNRVLSDRDVYKAALVNLGVSTLFVGLIVGVAVFF